MIVSEPQTTRKFLLITTVGKRAIEICRKWTRGPRNYDVFFIFYDKDNGSEFKQMADFYVERLGFKYPSIGKIFEEYSWLISKYDFFYLPDDDIELDIDSIMRLFSFAKAKRLRVCQPSISPYNYYWECFLNNPYTKYRYVKMVEVMCPLFSRKALKDCLPTFQKSQSGWGLDAVWAKLSNKDKKSFAVYDEVVANHTQPSDIQSGTLYLGLKKKGFDPMTELDKLLKEYNVKLDFTQGRCVYRNQFHQLLFDDLEKLVEKKKYEQLLERVYSINIILIKTCSMAKVELAQILSFWDFTLFVKGLSEEHTQVLESIYTDNEKILDERSRNILSRAESKQTAWVRKWLNLCAQHIIEQMKSGNSDFDVLKKAQTAIFSVTIDLLKINSKLQDIYIYLLYRYLKKPDIQILINESKA